MFRTRRAVTTADRVRAARREAERVIRAEAMGTDRLV